MCCKPVGPIVVALSLVVTGCATTSARRLPVRGRMIEVTLHGKSGDPIKGELLSVGPEVVLVLGAEGARKVPRVEIERVRVELHGLDGSKAGAWALVGALVTGAALAAACGSLEGTDCGGVIGLVGLSWGLIGAPSAVALGRSSRHILEGSELDALRPYARFPQGLPDGLDPDQLANGAGRGARAPGTSPGPR